MCNFILGFRRRLALATFSMLGLTLLSLHGRAADDKPVEKKAPAFELSKEEKALLELVNQERAKLELPPYKANEKLLKAARAHSANMARQNRLDHTLDGKDPGDRLRAVGYEHCGWGENVAAGQRTPEEAMQSWLSSPGHKANILSRQYAEIGLGIAKNADGTPYYTQVFAVPRER